MNSATIQSPSLVDRRTGLEVSLVADSKVALNVWRKLESELWHVSFACSHAWTSLWLKHYGDLIPHEFLVARINDNVVAIALLTNGVDQFNGPFRCRTRHLGTAGEPDEQSVCVEYNALLCKPEIHDAFIEVAVDHMKSQKDWDRISLDGFTERDLSFLNTFQHQHLESHYFDLAKARSAEVEPMMLLGKSTRKAIKRTRNAVGPLTVEWETQSIDGLDIFEELIDLHQARWTAVGEPGVYSNPRFSAFHRDAVSEFVESGKMCLVRISAGNATVGCGQFLVDNGRLLFYQGGWSEFGRNINPGMLFHYVCIEEALKRGFDAYDFLKGGARYKKSLSTDVETLVWAYFERPSIKAAIVTLGRRVKSAIRNYRTKRQEH